MGHSFDNADDDRGSLLKWNETRSFPIETSTILLSTEGRRRFALFVKEINQK